jgi:hypothetical protein
LIYKCVDKVAPNGTGVDIPNNSIFYLIKNDSSYDIYNNNGDRYDNITIQLKDAQNKSIDQNSTQILFDYIKYIRYNSYNYWYKNYRYDRRNGSFIVSKITAFDYSTLTDTTAEKNAKDDASREKERERIEKERLERERQERERLERERQERDRLEKERLEQERLERDRIERERLEKERLERDRIERERIERERIERESAAARARAEVIKNAQRQISETQVLPTYDETAPLFVAAQFNPL